MSIFARRPLPFACAALLAAGLALAAGAPTGAPVDGEGVVHDAMEGLKANLKVLASSTPDPEQRGAALGAVAEMQRLVLLAKVEAPTNLAEKPEAERAAHTLAFRREMARLLGELAKIEVALCRDQPDEALAAIKTTLLELRDAGHAAFQPGEGH